MSRHTVATFIKRLKRDWRVRFPWIENRALYAVFAKSHTFYVGNANKYRQHLFIIFQHNDKPSKVGQITVNLVFSPTEGKPSRFRGRLPNLDEPPEGIYRLGSVLYGRDKWWCLVSAPRAMRVVLHWAASSYGDQEKVLAEAIEDISGDVAALFERIGQPTKSFAAHQ